MTHLMAVTALATALLLPQAGTAKENTTALKAQLQAHLQRSIDRQLVEGAFMDLNLETGEMTPLYPVKAHPMVLRMGEDGNSFVLCSDLKSRDGKSVPVDFYMTRNGTRFTIIRTEIGNRAPLKALLKSGVAARLK